MNGPGNENEGVDAGCGVHFDGHCRSYDEFHANEHVRFDYYGDSRANGNEDDGFDCVNAPGNETENEFEN